MLDFQRQPMPMEVIGGHQGLMRDITYGRRHLALALEMFCCMKASTHSDG